MNPEPSPPTPGPLLRINVGCARSPTPGWTNFDNSLSVRLAKLPVVPELLKRLGMLVDAQYEMIEFARKNDIRHADVRRGLPVPDDSVEVLYSSHMVEHLDRSEVERFLRDARRILKPGGIIRLVVPDLRRMAEAYLRGGTADRFVEETRLALKPPRSLAQRLRFLLVGPRHHLWMYDGESLAALLEAHGFRDAAVLPPGQTRIPDPGPLDLAEREWHSVYVEAENRG